MTNEPLPDSELGDPTPYKPVLVPYGWFVLLVCLASLGAGVILSFGVIIR